jgi:L-amino acid N-acyltransferase YncA
MDSDIIICSAELHGEAIREIFNDAIVNTTALYDYTPRSMDTVRQWFGEKAKAGWPVIGAIDASGQLRGFASYGPFRPWPAYKYTIEHSVYVHPRQRRQGVARALLRQLVGMARERQFHVMIGGIDADNAASIALHEQLGFAHAGTIGHAGFKFGRWLDLAFYRLQLPGPDLPREG